MPGKSIRNPMSHSDIVREIAEQQGLTQAQVRNVLAAYKEYGQRHLQKGGVGEFKMLGMAKLKRTQRKARDARNPSTGETIRLPARRVVTAKPMSGAKNLDL